MKKSMYVLSIELSRSHLQTQKPESIILGSGESKANRNGPRVKTLPFIHA
jgi:hypothetical protein